MPTKKKKKGGRGRKVDAPVKVPIAEGKINLLLHIQFLVSLYHL